MRLGLRSCFYRESLNSPLTTSEALHYQCELSLFNPVKQDGAFAESYHVVSSMSIEYLPLDLLKIGTWRKIDAIE